MQPAARTTLQALATLFGDDYERRFGVALWDGTRVGPQQPFTLVVRHPGALRAALRAPVELSAGRAFAAGLLECEGNVEAAVDALMLAASSLDAARVVRIWRLTQRLPAPVLPALREARLQGFRHSRARDRAAIGFHYDQPLEFYSAFLDPRLVYSCAYYDDGVESLEDAQAAKLDHVLRKLRVKPGQRLLDIGCGWGALVIRAAQRFGARALGVTLSQSQFSEGNRRIAQAGVDSLARIELRDYRDLGSERFDCIASIGMFEHVGRSRLPEYFACAWKALQPGGLFLNHGIAAEGRHPRRRPPSFMERFVFPDGELVRIGEALTIAQDAGFEVRDVENLREHYARTLRAWVANLERNRDAAVAAAGEQSYRVWRLYMAGSAQGFRTRRIAIFQSLLGKPRDDGGVEVPATRRDLYA
ncbi:MAG: class I SAM-dependent methyltransferase [Candidatus Tyrphobacter sp.]